MTANVSKAPRTIDEFVAAIGHVETIEQLFAFFQDEIEREGYQNVVFTRLGSHADAFVIPYGCVPDGFAKEYLENRFAEHDPIIAASQFKATPFTWIDEMLRKTHSSAAWRVMESAKAHGVTGGLTMPFHRPGGRDLINLSMRGDRLLNAARIPIVNLKSYATLQRFIELEDATKNRISTTQDAEPSSGVCNQDSQSGECSEKLKHYQHGQGVGIMGDAECLAIVLSDMAWRRYSAGLIKLNQRLPHIVGEEALQNYIDRGLIEEEADDDRFRFFFKPSPVGQSHIKLCPCVPAIRNKIWDEVVEVGEMPEV